MSRSHERSEGLPRMPCVASKASIRFSTRTLSWTRCSRSRWRRLASSSSGVGTRTMLQACRSPRQWAISTRSRPWASSRSVLARRARRLTRMLVGSSTWLATPLAVSSRCSQKPSRPASKQQATSTAVPDLPATRARSAVMVASSAAVSPASIRCSFGLLAPGRWAASSQADLLSSSARKRTGPSWAAVRRAIGGSCARGRTPASLRGARPHSIWNQTSTGLPRACSGSAPATSAAKPS